MNDNSRWGEITGNKIEKAKTVIKEGELVIFPTETAYGIAADATNRNAVEKVFKAKDRSYKKKIGVITNDADQADNYSKMTPIEKRIVDEFMPGPLNLVVEKDPSIPDLLNEKFVFRISSNEVARELAAETPITATSANLSGAKTSYAVENISQELKEKVNLILDCGRLEKTPTSTIAELVNGSVKIHREGPITKNELESILD